MELYRNLGGNSGVVGYEGGPGVITVQFADGSAYLYTSATAGAYNLSRMKQLAIKGQGLNAFINLYVRKGYAKKLR